MEDRVARVLKLIADEARPDGAGRQLPPMQRLCRVAVRLVPASGAAVNVVATDEAPQLVAASYGVVHPFSGLEDVTGGGPGFDAFTTSQPVLVPEVEAVDPGRWPGYAAAARGSGVAAVFALPLQVGAVCLGAIELYRAEVGLLDDDEMARARTMGDAAVTLLLETQGGTDGASAALPYRAEIFQAQGMVMMQLGIPLAEAMMRLRAHAYVADRPLADVARDVISRHVLLDGQLDGSGS